MKVFWCIISVLVLLLTLVWSVCYAASVLSQLTDNNIDTLKAAVSLGRLDVITMLLAVVAILLGGFGFFGFNYIVEKSERTAEKIANEMATAKMIEKLADIKIEEIVTNRVELLTPQILEYSNVYNNDEQYVSQ